jgi:hypothetical protein
MARLTTYDDKRVEQAMAILHANGGNALKTSELTGIPRSTLRSWAGQTKFQPRTVNSQAVADKTVELAHRLEHVALLAVGPDMDAALANASAKDRAIVAGIAIEKRQLLIGAPTSRNETLRIELVAHGTLQELADRTMSGTTSHLAVGSGAGDVRD